MQSFPERNDALKYIQKDRKNIYLKYQMPTALFHRAHLNGPLLFGPSTDKYRFNENGTTNPSFVIPRSIDARNLEEVASNLPKLSYGRGVDMKVLKTRYTFPNFLLGEMLYKSEGAPESTEVFRPYQIIDDNYREFWVKIYGTGFYFPYNKSKYFLPPGYHMVERADGVIMYFNENTKIMKSDFPLGSYMIIPDGETIGDVINNTETCQEIEKRVMEVLQYLYKDTKGGTTNLEVVSDITAQQHFGLVAYMTNLESVINKYVNLEEEEEEYGGNKKKKSKRTNIKYMKKMKRTKRTKRTKRMNIKYMKKSKKNHHK
jgi:hypothetical protein